MEKIIPITSVSEDEDYAEIACYCNQNGLQIFEDGNNYYILEENEYVEGGEILTRPAAETTIDELKAQKIKDILAYDISPEVNSFYFAGERMWLDKATRVGLMNSLTIEDGIGRAATTLWLNGKSYSMEITTAKNFLMQLEVYALACYNNTQTHIAAVQLLGTAEAIAAYDITTGYPAKAQFFTPEQDTGQTPAQNEESQEPATDEEQEPEQTI